MHIRQATVTDAHAIATIHVEAWQSAYVGIVPQAFLDSLSIEDRTRGWEQQLQSTSTGVWVAEHSGSVVGWVLAYKSRDADAAPATGEVGAIYISPTHWRIGAGRLLWERAERDFRESGFSALTVWVLDANARAIAFYTAHGCHRDPGSEKTISIAGAELVEVRFRKSLDAAIAQM
jgi:L-amino acid N-acyltransferase YncA